MSLNVQLNQWAVCILLLAIFGCSTSAPTLSESEVRTHMTHPQLWTTDTFGKLYVIDQKNEVTSYNGNWSSQNTYADNTLGEITSLDASNPLKLLIYKSNYGRISILDNTLSILRTIDLFSLGFNDVPIASSSTDGHIWLYDKVDFNLKKIDYNGSTLLESLSLRYENMQDFNPTGLLERNGFLILFDNKGLILLFDNLGQYMRSYPFTSGNHINFDGKYIYLYQGERIVIIDILSSEQQTMDIAKKVSGQAPLDFLVTCCQNYLIYRDGIDVIDEKDKED